MKKLVAPLNIVIDQDWTVFSDLTSFDLDIMSESRDKKECRMMRPGDDHCVMYMGGLGSKWHIHSGKRIHALMPWYNDFLEIVKPLQYDGCGFSKHESDIDEHFDILECHSDSGEQHTLVPDGQCKINYVIGSTDPMSKTIVTQRDDPTNIQSYGTSGAWLLDVNHLHRLECKGHREMLSFKFCESFDTVFDYFDKLGPLTFR